MDPPSYLYKGDFNQVFTSLYEVRNKWKHLGSALDVDIIEIEDIETKHRSDSKKCLHHLIIYCLESKELTWPKICTALEKKVVDCSNLAGRLREKFTEKSAKKSFYKRRTYGNSKGESQSESTDEESSDEPGKSVVQC